MKLYLVTPARAIALRAHCFAASSSTGLQD